LATADDAFGEPFTAALFTGLVMGAVATIGWIVRERHCLQDAQMRRKPTSPFAQDR
jgi:hypothetical protein